MAKQLVTGLSPGDVEKYALLCGEPERVPKIASLLKEPKKVLQYREYTLYRGELDGTPVSVASTGIGGPSTAILIEEMANLGTHTFVRIGTSGGIAEGVRKGDFVVATGAIRRDGTSRSYVWRDYPAAASHEAVLALIDAATQLKLRFDAGICLSVDGFYSENKMLKDGKICSMSECGYMLSSMVERLADAKRMGVKNIEMENATIFTLCSLFGLRAGAVCSVSDVTPWHPTEGIVDFDQNITDCVRIGVEGMRNLIAWDKKKNGAKFWTPSLR